MRRYDPSSIPACASSPGPPERAMNQPRCDTVTSGRRLPTYAVRPGDRPAGAERYATGHRS